MPYQSFLRLNDLDAAEIERLIDLAEEFKRGVHRRPYLQNLTLGMLFSVPSTRTRVSFQVAARHLGAHAEHFTPQDLQLSNNESLIDTAVVLGRYLDGLIVRMYDMTAYGAGRRALETIAAVSGIPVINALDDKDHPCQVMADLLTLRECFGADFRHRKVVFSWVYTKRQKSLGVPHSLLVAGSLLGMDLTFAHPEGYELDPEYLEFARGAAERSGAVVRTVNSLEEAAEGAHVIYAKNWKSLTMSKDEDEAHRNSIRDRWMITERTYRNAAPGALYMDCMPFVRGEQVSAEVADGPRSIIYDQAENRLHAQKAILTHLFAGHRHP